MVASLDELGVDHLVTIGGDDTAFSAWRVAEKAGGRIRVAHVPKTIDNDLPLPAGIPTFGFETARENATRLLSHLMEDARTTRRWYFIVVMGRNAGHLALGAAIAAGVTLFLIPEHFPEGRIRFHTVANLLEGAIIKRRVMDRPYGVAVIAEGVGERLDPDDLEVLKDVERDEHGHIRLSEVPLGKVLRYSGPGRAGGARHQGHHRREGPGLRASLRGAQCLRPELHPRSRCRCGADAALRQLRSDDHPAGRDHRADSLERDDRSRRPGAPACAWWIPPPSPTRTPGHCRCASRNPT